VVSKVQRLAMGFETRIDRGSELAALNQTRDAAGPGNDGRALGGDI
jgi:hypothetical protein